MNSSELKGYLTGLILGDGYIDSGISKRAFRIKSTNKEFAEKIYNDIKSVNTFKVEIKEFDEYDDKYGVHHKKCYEVKIKSHPYFAKIFHYFYNDKRERIITKKALSWLTLEGLANWYMSDGYICRVGKTKGKIYNRRVELCCDRYTKSDVEKIQKYLLEKWGWETTIKKRKTKGKTLYRIYFKVVSAQDFLMKIAPYVVETFYYKLDMAYDEPNYYVSEEYYEFMKKIQEREHPNE